MQTCTVFATYTNWLSRELEKADPDLSGTTKPPTMTDAQWKHFQAIRAARPSQSSSSSSQSQSQSPSQPDSNTQQQQQQQQQPPLPPPQSEGGGDPPKDSDKSTKEKEDKESAKITELFDVIRKWETNFSRHLQILLDALNHYAATETVVLLSLCARLSTANQGTEWAGRGRTEDESVGVVGDVVA